VPNDDDDDDDDDNDDNSAWSELEISMYKVTVMCAVSNIYQERETPQLSKQHITAVLLTFWHRSFTFKF
jgi:hypothetical protein